MIKEDKKSTKLRILFDASAKGRNGVSLNDCLYKGPSLSPLLYDLFFKFRMLIMNINEIFKETLLITPTKRNVLKIIASVYDPIGFLQAILIKLKILFQDICKLKMDWDDNIGDLTSRWNNIVSSLKSMKKIIIDRCYCISEITDPIILTSLHGFSDASEVAYTACIYIKSVKKSGNIVLNLVTSKSRVVPLKKKLTIPRLELLGNLILSRVMRNVIDSLSAEIVINCYYCWSDSKISLAWIAAISKELKMFC